MGHEAFEEQGVDGRQGLERTKVILWRQGERHGAGGREVLTSIYTPILECLVSHLPTSSKLALSQSSKVCWLGGGTMGDGQDSTE